MNETRAARRDTDSGSAAVSYPPKNAAEALLPDGRTPDGMTNFGFEAGTSEGGSLPEPPPTVPPAPHLRRTEREYAAAPRKQPENALPLAEPQLRTTGLAKAYRKAAVEIPVLRGVDLEVHPGEFLAIVGQSGSGKSTLLHLLGLLDRPDQGSIRLAGARIDDLPPTKRDHLRNRCFGMVFQFYHLLPELTALENVMVPALIATNPWTGFRERSRLRRRAMELLELMGLSHRLRHRPRELSGGEMQRTAIARALMNRPQILLADEPTGNLDQATGREILKTLRTLNGIENLTIVMVTHDPTIAAQADRVVRLREGRVVPA